MNCELKYCEHCGSLLLRPAGSGKNYCRECVRRLLHFLPSLQRLRAGLQHSTMTPRKRPRRSRGGKAHLVSRMAP